VIYPEYHNILKNMAIYQTRNTFCGTRYLSHCHAI